MLATSMRQPSSSKGGLEPVPGHCGHSPAKLRRAPVELRQGANPEPRLVPVRQGVVEVEELALGRSGLAQAAVNQSCATPTWLSVRSPITRMPRRWAASVSEASARRLRAAGRRGRRTSRRTGGCSSPGRSGSGRSHWRRVLDVHRAFDAREVAVEPRGVSGPRPVGNSSQERGTAHSGREPLSASGRERSGRRPSAGAIPALRGPARARSRRRPHVVVDQPDAVHPPVADVPAGEHPAVQRDGVPDWKVARHQVSVSVSSSISARTAGSLSRT